MEYHNPVLLNESIKGLSIKPGGLYVDVTFGGGGHSSEIFKHLQDGKLVGFEQDEEALSQERLKFFLKNIKADKNIKLESEKWVTINNNKILLLNHNFKYIKNFLNYSDIQKVDGIIADLGVSSHQFDISERGFSIRFDDADIDMRMSKKNNLSARDILNDYSIEKLTEVFANYGEIERPALVAKEINEYRSHHKIITVSDLKKAVQRFVPKHNENKFFSKLFQSLRIEVNKELDVLKSFLLQAGEILDKSGRLVVISYHSLEDRLVKNFMRSGNFEGVINKDFYGNMIAPFKIITRKAIIPNEEEIKNNSRARSAKLRIAEKI